MSRSLKVDTITTLSGDVITSPAVIHSPGRVLQIQQTVFRTQFSSSIGPGWVDVPGMACSISPIFANSKVLVNLSLNYGTGYWQYKVRLLRNGQLVTGCLGDAAGSRPQAWLMNIQYDGTAGTTTYDMSVMNGQYLDTPGDTGPQQYSIQIGGYSTSYVVYINRSNTFSNLQSYDGLPISTLTLTEIAA
jgi:hypothetical protein